jgi:signal transduction histidine kinase
MGHKSRKIKFIFLFYWFLLAYIIAALVWWYIALSKQNEQMAAFKIHILQTKNQSSNSAYQLILHEKNRKTKQYIGEGAIFLLLIVAGAGFVYAAIRKQLAISQQQQNFMMAVTHELKTPIAVTKLNLETLQKRKLDDQQQVNLLNNTIQEANRMNTLCDNLLLSSQMEAGGYQITKEKISLVALVQRIIEDYTIRYPFKNIEASIKTNVDIEGDSFLLQMAINNVIDNAIKYSPKDTPIEVSVEQKENTIRLSIIDQGIGIPTHEHKKIFKKFYRIGTEATKKAKGTGLGLYLVDKIIKKHGGQVLVQKNEPKGSIFVIEIKKLA